MSSPSPSRNNSSPTPSFLHKKGLNRGRMTVRLIVLACIMVSRFMVSIHEVRYIRCGGVKPWWAPNDYFGKFGNKKKKNGKNKTENNDGESDDEEGDEKQNGNDDENQNDNNDSSLPLSTLKNQHAESAHKTDRQLEQEVKQREEIQLKLMRKMRNYLRDESAMSFEKANAMTQFDELPGTGNSERTKSLLPTADERAQLAQSLAAAAEHQLLLQQQQQGGSATSTTNKNNSHYNGKIAIGDLVHTVATNPQDLVEVMTTTIIDAARTLEEIPFQTDFEMYPPNLTSAVFAGIRTAHSFIADLLKYRSCRRRRFREEIYGFPDSEGGNAAAQVLKNAIASGNPTGESHHHHHARKQSIIVAVALPSSHHQHQQPLLLQKPPSQIPSKDECIKRIIDAASTSIVFKDWPSSIFTHVIENSSIWRQGWSAYQNSISAQFGDVDSKPNPVRRYQSGETIVFHGEQDQRVCWILIHGAVWELDKINKKDKRCGLTVNSRPINIHGVSSTIAGDILNALNLAAASHTRSSTANNNNNNNDDVNPFLKSAKSNSRRKSNSSSPLSKKNVEKLNSNNNINNGTNTPADTKSEVPSTSARTHVSIRTASNPNTNNNNASSSNNNNMNDKNLSTSQRFLKLQRVGSSISFSNSNANSDDIYEVTRRFFSSTTQNNNNKSDASPLLLGAMMQYKPCVLRDGAVILQAENDHAFVAASNCIVAQLPVADLENCFCGRGNLSTAVYVPKPKNTSTKESDENDERRNYQQDPNNGVAHNQEEEAAKSAAAVLASSSTAVGNENSLYSYSPPNSADWAALAKARNRLLQERSANLVRPMTIDFLKSCPLLAKLSDSDAESMITHLKKCTFLKNATVVPRVLDEDHDDDDDDKNNKNSNETAEEVASLSLKRRRKNLFINLQQQQKQDPVAKIKGLVDCIRRGEIHTKSKEKADACFCSDPASIGILRESIIWIVKGNAAAASQRRTQATGMQWFRVKFFEFRSGTTLGEQQCYFQTEPVFDVTATSMIDIYFLPRLALLQRTMFDTAFRDAISEGALRLRQTTGVNALTIRTLRSVRWIRDSIVNSGLLTDFHLFDAVRDFQYRTFNPGELLACTSEQVESIFVIAAGHAVHSNMAGSLVQRSVPHWQLIGSEAAVFPALRWKRPIVAMTVCEAWCVTPQKLAKAFLSIPRAMRIVADDGVTIIACRPQRPPLSFGGERNVLYQQQLAAAEWNESAESQKRKLLALRKIADLHFENQEEVVKCVLRVTKQIVAEMNKKKEKELQLLANNNNTNNLDQDENVVPEKSSMAKSTNSNNNNQKDLMNISMATTTMSETTATPAGGGGKAVTFNEKNIQQQQILQQEPNEASAINLSAAVASIVITPDTTTYRTLRQLPQVSPQRREQQEKDSRVLLPMRQFQDQFTRQEFLDRTRKLWHDIEHMSSSETRRRSDFDKAKKLDAMLHSPPRIAVKTQLVHGLRGPELLMMTNKNNDESNNNDNNYDKRLTELVMEEMLKIKEKQMQAKKDRRELLKKQQISESQKKTFITVKKTKKVVKMVKNEKNKKKRGNGADDDGSSSQNNSTRSSLRPVEIGDDYDGQLVEFDEEFDEEIEVSPHSHHQNENEQNDDDDDDDEEYLHQIEDDDEAEAAIRRITMQLRREQDEKKKQQYHQKKAIGSNADEEANNPPRSGFENKNNNNEYPNSTQVPSRTNKNRAKEFFDHADDDHDDDEYSYEIEEEVIDEEFEPQPVNPNNNNNNNKTEKKKTNKNNNSFISTEIEKHQRRAVAIESRLLSVQLTPQQRQETQMQEKMKQFQLLAPKLMAKYNSVFEQEDLNKNQQQKQQQIMEVAKTPPPPSTNNKNKSSIFPARELSHQSKANQNSNQQESFNSLPIHLQQLLGVNNNNHNNSNEQQHQSSEVKNNKRFVINKTRMSPLQSHCGSLVGRARDLVRHAAAAIALEEQQTK